MGEKNVHREKRGGKKREGMCGETPTKSHKAFRGRQASHKMAGNYRCVCVCVQTRHRVTLWVMMSLLYKNNFCLRGSGDKSTFRVCAMQSEENAGGRQQEFLLGE